MAKIENSFGIRSTYYFWKNEEVFKPAMINEIVNMGHEIGYHYEVLDKTKGDYEEAAALLNKGENVFAWAPSFKEWLKDPDYVFWLGAGGLRIAT